jgi:hypothetical protein
MYLSYDRLRDDIKKNKVEVSVTVKYFAASERRLSEGPVYQIICEGPKLYKATKINVTMELSSETEKCFVRSQGNALTFILDTHGCKRCRV